MSNLNSRSRYQCLGRSVNNLACPAVKAANKGEVTSSEEEKAVLTRLIYMLKMLREFKNNGNVQPRNNDKLLQRSSNIVHTTTTKHPDVTSPSSSHWDKSMSTEEKINSLLSTMIKEENDRIYHTYPKDSDNDRVKEWTETMREILKAYMKSRDKNTLDREMVLKYIRVLKLLDRYTKLALSTMRPSTTELTTTSATVRHGDTMEQELSVFELEMNQNSSNSHNASNATTPTNHTKIEIDHSNVTIATVNVTLTTHRNIKNMTEQNTTTSPSVPGHSTTMCASLGRGCSNSTLCKWCRRGKECLANSEYTDSRCNLKDGVVYNSKPLLPGIF